MPLPPALRSGIKALMFLSSKSFSQRGEEGFLCISKVQGLLLSNHFFSFRGKELIFPGWKRNAAWKGEGGCGLYYGQVTRVLAHLCCGPRLWEMLVYKLENQAQVLPLGQPGQGT